MDTDYFTLVLGELVPKRIAMKRSDSIARAVSGLMIGMSSVLKPVIWLLTVSTNAVLRLCGIDPNDNAEEVSEEEIIMMLDEGEEAGSIESGEKKLIKNVFALNDTSAENVMVHRSQVCFLRMDDPREKLLDEIAESGYSRFPVCGESVDDVVGIITLEDILEELVGEIWDENDEIVTPVTFVSENEFNVNGDVSLTQFKRYWHNRTDKYPNIKGNAKTIGGWVLELFGKIPETNEMVTTEDFRITVLKVSERRIVKVRLTVLPEKEDR